MRINKPVKMLLKRRQVILIHSRPRLKRTMIPLTFLFARMENAFLDSMRKTLKFPFARPLMLGTVAIKREAPTIAIYGTGPRMLAPRSRKKPQLPRSSAPEKDGGET